MGGTHPAACTGARDTHGHTHTPHTRMRTARSHSDTLMHTHAPTCCVITRPRLTHAPLTLTCTDGTCVHARGHTHTAHTHTHSHADTRTHTRTHRHAHKPRSHAHSHTPAHTCTFLHTHTAVLTHTHACTRDAVPVPGGGRALQGSGQGPSARLSRPVSSPAGPAHLPGRPPSRPCPPPWAPGSFPDSICNNNLTLRRRKRLALE